MFRKYYYFVTQNLRSIFDFMFFEWRRMNIKQDEIVADFGCGGRPLLRANILVDKFLEGITERPTEFLDTGAYVVQCNLDSLPFKKKTIDFIYSSHVIEHLEDLDIALQEMQRVGRGGYITCPSAMREQIMAHKMHLWFIEKRENQLFITKKGKPYPNYIGNFFDKFIASDNSYIWINFEKNFKKEFFIDYFWKGKINYKIYTDEKQNKWKIEGETKFKNKKNIFLTLREKILIVSSKIIRLLYSNEKNMKIEKILCCPDCKEDLTFINEYMVCNQCHQKFLHKNKRIFYFLNRI